MTDGEVRFASNVAWIYAAGSCCIALYCIIESTGSAAFGAALLAALWFTTGRQMRKLSLAWAVIAVIE